MSRREVRALKEDQTEPEATLRGQVTRSGKVLVETTNFDEVERDDTAAEDDSMEELRTRQHAPQILLSGMTSGYRVV